MSSNSITRFISTAKNLSDLHYIETFFEKHSLTPLSLEKCIVKDLERLFDSVLNTPIPNNDHMKGLLGVIKCMRQISLCKDDEQWLILHECFTSLISKCTRYIMTHLDVDNSLFGEILQLILKIIIDSSRHHISIKNKMLQCLSPLIFDIIINKKPPLDLEKLCIQSLTLLVTRSDQDRRKEVMDLVYPKLAKFFDHLYSCGDYDTQLCIVETILRFIVPDKNRKMFFVNFKHKNPNVIRNFLNVRSKDFDTDCRVFLNYVNKSQEENALVISVPCYSVLLNERIIEKPPEQELFWIDFNRGAQTVSIWCNKNSLLTPEESTIPDYAASTDWQLLTIKPQVVTEVKVKSIKPCDEVQRNFKEVQFIINGPLEIRPLEELLCSRSKCVRILFPRSKETEALEQKVLPTIFKMRKLDRINAENKMKGESVGTVGNSKYSSSVTVYPIGVDSTNCINISRIPSSEDQRFQKPKECDESTKEKSKILSSGRKISTTKTKIEFQSFLDSDNEKENRPRNTSTKQILEVSDEELIQNHREPCHTEKDETKSAVAGRSLLDKNVNRKVNKEVIAINQQNCEENEKIMKPNIDVCLNSPGPQTSYAKISTTVERCNFFMRNPGNCGISVHSGNVTLNSNSFTVGERVPEIHGSTNNVRDISDKNLSKQEPEKEVANGKMNRNISANCAGKLSNKEMSESRSEFYSHKENVNVFKSINTCSLNVSGNNNNNNFGSSKENLSSPFSKKNVEEIDVTAVTKKNEKRRTIKISTSTDKCIFNLKNTVKKNVFSDTLNKTTSSPESIKVNHLLQSNATENRQTSKQDCNSIKTSDLDEILNKPNYPEVNDKKVRRVSVSLHTCLFEPSEKIKRIQESTKDVPNYIDNFVDEISTDKMSMIKINDENIVKCKSKESKNVTYGDLNHKFPNSEKTYICNSLAPINKMSGDKNCIRADEVIPCTINENMNIKETSETTCSATDSSKEFLNSKITETDTALLPSIKNRDFTTYECSQKQSTQINKANKMENERVTEEMVKCCRKPLQFNIRKGNSDCITTIRKSERIQNARRHSENVSEIRASKASRKREKRKYFDNDSDVKHFKNTPQNRLQMNKKRNGRKNLVNAPSIPDESAERMEKTTDIEIANKINSGDTYFKRKLRKDNAHCGINKIQDMHARLGEKRNGSSKNVCKFPEDERLENKSVSKLENNKQETHCKLLITETPSSVYLKNCEDLSNEEPTDTGKPSKSFLINEIVSVNVNHDPDKRKHHLKINTRSKTCSLKNYKKTIELCNAEARESSFQTCVSGTGETDSAYVNRPELEHNSSPEKNDDNNNKTCLQERVVSNLSNELRNAECVDLTNDFKEVYTKNSGCASEVVKNTEGKSQGLYAENEIQGNTNSENEVHNLTYNKECVTKNGIIQHSPCSQSNVSQIMTNAIVHVSSQSSSPRDNQSTVKTGVDTVITQSVKVFKFFSQNITSVEKDLNAPLNFQNENKTNTTKHIVNTVKDSVEKLYIQETVTSKRQFTNNCKNGKVISEVVETHCEDSNKQNDVIMINKGTRASTKKRKSENIETKHSFRKKNNQCPLSRSDNKSNTTSRSLRKRKAISYIYNSPINTDEENKGKHEVNNCSRNKAGRSSVKKKLFTQNEVDIVSLCSGSQSCSAEKDTQEENSVETKKCNPNKSQSKIDEFDKLLSTSPPPLPKRNPNHWEEKYRKDIQLKSLKHSSSNQKIINSKKTKHSVYSDLDSSSDVSVCFNKAEHERKPTAAEDTGKNNFVTLIKTEDTNSEINSKSKDPNYCEKNDLFTLNLNNSIDSLETNTATMQLSPKRLVNKLPSVVEKERNCKVNSKNPHKRAGEVVIDKVKHGLLEDGKPFVKNTLMDIEQEKVKKSHSKSQIDNENNGGNTEFNCNSKDQTVEQIIQQGNCDKLLSMISTYDNKRITSQPEKSINNYEHSEELQQLNLNSSLKRKNVSQNIVNANETYEISSVQRNKDTRYKEENVLLNTSIGKSNQRLSCKNKSKLIAYSDTDSDCGAKICATNEEHQNKETSTVNLHIKESNEYFTANENNSLVTNAVNKDISRNVDLPFVPNDTVEQLQINESTRQLTPEVIINQPEILVYNEEYSKLLQHEKGNNSITRKLVTQDIGHNDAVSQFAVHQNNEEQLKCRKDIKYNSVGVKTQCHEQVKYLIEDKSKDDIKKSRKPGSKGNNKQMGNSENEDFLFLHCNEKHRKKSACLETKCIIPNGIDDTTPCKAKELQRSLIHSTNKKQKCHESNDEYINDIETDKDRKILSETPLKCNVKFENKRNDHKKIQKLMETSEKSPPFLKNRHKHNKLLNNGNNNSETFTNDEYMREMNTLIRCKKSTKKGPTNCSKENERSDVELNDSKIITRDNRSIHNTKQTQLIQGDSVSCDEELYESWKEVGSRIYQDIRKFPQNCQLEMNDKLNIDDGKGTRFSNQKTCIHAASTIKSGEIVERHSKGQMQSKKFTSQLRYKMDQNQKTEYCFLQKPLVRKWSSETDGSPLSSTETIDEYSKEQSTSMMKIRNRKFKTSSLKKEFQKSIHGKIKYLKEFSGNISNAFLEHFSQTSDTFHARRTDSRKYLDVEVQHKIEKTKNNIEALQSFIDGMEEKLEEVNDMIINQNCIEEDIKQNFIHIENEYKKFATDLSHEPKFDIQHLISSLGEKFRKETLRNMLKKLHDVCDVSL